MRQRYAVMMDPALAALSAVAVVWGSRWLAQRLTSNSKTRQWAISLIVVIVVAGFMTGAVQQAFSAPSPDTFPDLNLPAVQYVWQNTTENDCIVTDDQRFAFAVNRLVPPKLSETTAGRLAAGWLTTDDVIQQTELYDCPMVVYADWRFAKYLPELEIQLRDRFFLKIPFAEDMVVYTGKKQVTRSPDVSLKQQLGEDIIVEGVDMTPPPWQPGQEVRLATYWTAVQSPDRAYKIFLQLRNRRDEPVVNFDHFPFPVPAGGYQPVPHIDNIRQYSAQDIAAYPAKGMMPTNAWPVGSTIREVIPMKLPSTLSAGTYNLFIGMYDPDTQVRLPTQTDAGESVELLVAQIEIVEAR
jgi:hypothetical protein